MSGLFCSAFQYIPERLQGGADLVVESFRSMCDYFINQFRAIRVNDVIDILIVSIVLYYLFRFIRDRRASKLTVGIILLFILYLLSNVFELNTIRFIMDNIFQVGLIAAMIIFQPEMRSMLENFGGQTKRFKELAARGNGANENMVEEIARAAADLSRDRTGALIVIQKNTPLGDYIKSGTVVNADITSALLRNLFFNKSPMHDGAVIIRDGRIYAAGCFLPLTMNNEIMKELGTRHRAAIGASENSDAVIVVVSEENGVISIASDGKLRRGFNYEMLRQYLTDVFIEPVGKRTKKKGRFSVKTRGNGGEQ